MARFTAPSCPPWRLEMEGPAEGDEEETAMKQDESSMIQLEQNISKKTTQALSSLSPSVVFS